MHIDRNRAIFAQENARGYHILAAETGALRGHDTHVKLQEAAARHARIARAHMGIEGSVVRTSTVGAV